MPPNDEIPDEFLENISSGYFGGGDFLDWLQDHPDVRQDIDEYMDAGMSLEWSVIAEDRDMPLPSEWAHVDIDRDMDGTWEVTVTDNDGNTYEGAVFQGDELASDLIWADLFFSIIDEYDIDYDKDIDYAED